VDGGRLGDARVTNDPDLRRVAPHDRSLRARRGDRPHVRRGAGADVPSISRVENAGTSSLESSSGLRSTRLISPSWPAWASTSAPEGSTSRVTAWTLIGLLSCCCVFCPAASTSTFCRSVRVTAFSSWRGFTVMSTSTRSPGRTNPDTPETWFTSMLAARIFGRTSMERPPPREDSLIAVTGSRAPRKTFVVCPITESMSAYAPSGTASLG
jgi:hypothetical protein